MERKEPYATQEEFNQRVIPYRDIPPIELIPNIKAHILSSERMAVLYITLAPNSVGPLHRHEPEEIMIVVEGECDQVVEGKLYHLKEGDVIISPSNVEHGTYVSERGLRVIEVFAPSRPEYTARVEEAKRSLLEG